DCSRQQSSILTVDAIEHARERFLEIAAQIELLENLPELFGARPDGLACDDIEPVLQAIPRPQGATDAVERIRQLLLEGGDALRAADTQPGHWRDEPDETEQEHGQRA